MAISTPPSSAKFPGLTLKAWAQFTGAGVLVKSSNVTSVTRGSAGLYNLVFPVSTFVGTSYIADAVFEAGGVLNVPLVSNTSSKAALAATVQTWTAGGVASDCGMCHVAFYE